VSLFIHLLFSLPREMIGGRPVSSDVLWIGADSRVTGKHIYDLAWSPDSEFLIAGSTDNTASIWKAGTGKLTFFLRNARS